MDPWRRVRPAVDVRELLTVQGALRIELLLEPKDAVHEVLLSVKVLELLIEVVLPIDLLVSDHLLVRQALLHVFAPLVELIAQSRRLED